jgi:RimJ/RimL family protein N-acetyltransferase
MTDPGNSSDFFRLIFNKDDNPVGEISYHHFDPNNRIGKFNIKIISAERGKGYTREVMRLFLDYFFVTGHDFCRKTVL